MSLDSSGKTRNDTSMSVFGSDRKYYLFALKIVGNFGVTIAAPVVLFVLVGQYLEGRYGHEPYFTIGGFAVAALLSGRIIYKKAKEYGREYQKLSE